MYNHTNIICKSLVLATFGLLVMPTTPMKASEIPASVTAPQPNATTIRGTVTDEINEPLPGATIFVKGTKNGTSTDIDGNFEINVHRQGKVTLVVSYVGMKTKEVQATSGSKLDIVLETNADMLEEVIVSGFQTISRERNTGSAVVVGAEKLGKIQAPDLSSKLEGVTPGLT
ncbi:MAG: carboxypeptidase-like regulatory domain-containing protein, partial [Duncaniella sp.]|nr:carboxypeptidase-like regulatory domain-containing protein [Duncaniella sp.]